MKGMGRIFKRGEIFWIAYCHRGKEFRESSHSTSERTAAKLLKKRIAEMGRGSRFIGPAEERVTFEDLTADLIRYYQINGKHSLASLPYWLAHLRKAFGNDRAVDITPSRMKAYVASRLDEGATPATINRELGALKRMFALAVRDNGRLTSAPYIRLLEENNARQGFVEPGDFARLRDALPGYLRDTISFLYLSGWRKGEMQTLEWRDVELEPQDGTIRLRAERSKNRRGRTLKLRGELLEIIARAAQARRLDCPFVFHSNGQPIGDFRKAWKAACREAGLDGVLVHDLRRSGVRNMVRSGVPERVAMEISGHRTRSMFDRYNIVSEGDLDSAAERITAYVNDHQQDAKVTPLTKERAA